MLDYYNQIFTEERIKAGENTLADIEAERYLIDLKLDNKFNRWSLLLNQKYLNHFYQSRIILHSNNTSITQY